MSRHREEHEFGSDSFLDVLANLVGILIILIVAVGVRVANTPPEELLQKQEGTEVVAASLAPLQPRVSQPIRDLPPLPRFDAMPEIHPTEAMLERARELKTHYDALIQEQAKLANEEELLTQQLAAHRTLIDAMQKQISQSAERLESDKSKVSTLEQDVAALRTQVAALRNQAEAINLDEPPVEQLKHHLPPIGRVVAGDEVHFRLHGNRITYVPLNELVLDVRQDMERRKEILLNRSFFQGRTRAIEGYMMEYVLQRVTGNLADDLRYGNGMIRIGVSSWVVKPVGPFKQETADEAVRSGSHFLDILSKHGPTSTVTFWVYPDSFEAHQKLKAFTHDAGYWVASRPLPTGVPIAGSPQGSKSVAQ